MNYYFLSSNFVCTKLIFMVVYTTNSRGNTSMEEIELKEINLSALQKLQSQGTTSTIYTDGDMCYKFLDGLYPYEKRDLYRKFLAMDGIQINDVLLPQKLIIEDGELKGYTMEYFANSMPLSDKFLTRYFNCKDLFIYVERASKILRTIHSNGIVCQDLSFENILVDDKGNVKFCDMDSCTYRDYNSPFFSILFKQFLIDYRGSWIYEKEDVDKVSMILSFYLTMYGEPLQIITKKQYHTLSDHIQTLENLRNTANMLVDKSSPIKDIPYLDEVIDLKDDYEIDREKILSIHPRIFTKFK